MIKAASLHGWSGLVESCLSNPAAVRLARHSRAGVSGSSNTVGGELGADSATWWPLIGVRGLTREASRQGRDETATQPQDWSHSNPADLRGVRWNFMDGVHKDAKAPSSPHIASQKADLIAGGSQAATKLSKFSQEALRGLASSRVRPLRVDRVERWQKCSEDWNCVANSTLRSSDRQRQGLAQLRVTLEVHGGGHQMLGALLRNERPAARTPPMGRQRWHGRHISELEGPCSNLYLT